MIEKITSEKAWNVYNFISDYKNGLFGIVSLQTALDNNFDNWVKEQKKVTDNHVTDEYLDIYNSEAYQEELKKIQ